MQLSSTRSLWPVEIAWCPDTPIVSSRNLASIKSVTDQSAS
jgi:hypothetical protein